MITGCTRPLAGVSNVNVHASDGTLATESMIWLSGTHYTDAKAGNELVPMKLHP